MNYTISNTLTEIVLNNLKAAFIFQNYNLNYSTEGKKTLKEACSFAGIKPAVILNDLKKLNGMNSDYLKVNEWRIDFLCDYIESNHHKYIRKMLPKIIAEAKILTKKKIIPASLSKELKKMSIDFETHMQKEERLLFPYIKKMNTIFNEKSEYEIPPFGSVANPVKVLEKEHSLANSALNKIKKLCGGYKTVPNDDINMNKFYEYMKEFETDFHLHIHFENNVLFPKAVAMEKKLKKLFFKI